MIYYVLKLLSEKDNLPLFMSTCEMVQETPLANPCSDDNVKGEMKTKLEEIEKSLNTLLKKGHNGDNSNSITRDGEYSVDNTTAKIESQSPNISSGVTWAENDDCFMLNAPTFEENPDRGGWSKIPERAKKIETTRKTWRQRLNILRGTAVGDIEAPLSDDVHLVAYGLGKGTTNVQLSEWLKAKGVNIKSCDLLTKHEAAQSLSYKITVKASEYDKVTNPEIWPERNGVRRFKLFGVQRVKKNEMDKPKKNVANLKGLRILLMPVITSPD